jgi:anti-anti-sigma factor
MESDMLSAHHGRSRHPVIEVDDVIDFDNEDAVGQDLDRLIAGCGSRAVIIDVTTPLVTSAALHVLVRARQRADALGVVLCVVARRPSARKVFRLTGLHRTLRVTATLSGAEALCRRCACGPAVAAVPVLPRRAAAEPVARPAPS